MPESMEGIKLLVSLFDWLRKFRQRESEGSQPVASQPAVVVNPGVNLDANKLAEQSATTARELGRMESENAWLRSENTDLRKARDAAIADLQQRSRTADDPSRIKRALAELEKGHPEDAEDLFRGVIMENRREAARAAYNIGAIAFHHDTQKALRAFLESAELDPSTVDAWIWIGDLQRQMGHLEEAESTFDKLLGIGNSNGDDALRAIALSHIGTVFMNRGDWDMAKDKHMAALKLNEKLGDRKGVARSYCEIGTVHLSCGDLVGAEKMYRKSLALNENMGDTAIRAMLYCNLGVVLEKRGDLNGAEEMYRKLLMFCKELGHKEGMASAYVNLGNIFQSRGDLCRAEEMLRKSLRINEYMGYKEGMAVNYTNLGTLSKAQGNLEEACRLWKKARDFFSDMGARDRVEIVEQAMQNAGCEL